MQLETVTYFSIKNTFYLIVLGFLKKTAMDLKNTSPQLF